MSCKVWLERKFFSHHVLISLYGRLSRTRDCHSSKARRSVIRSPKLCPLLNVALAAFASSLLSCGLTKGLLTVRIEATAKQASKQPNNVPNIMSFAQRKSAGIIAMCRPSAVSMLSSNAPIRRRSFSASSTAVASGGVIVFAKKSVTSCAPIAFTLKHNCSSGVRRISGSGLSGILSASACLVKSL